MRISASQELLAHITQLAHRANQDDDISDTEIAQIQSAIEQGANLDGQVDEMEQKLIDAFALEDTNKNRDGIQANRANKERVIENLRSLAQAYDLDPVGGEVNFDFSQVMIKTESSTNQGLFSTFFGFLGFGGAADAINDALNTHTVSGQSNALESAAVEELQELAQLKGQVDQTIGDNPDSPLAKLSGLLEQLGNETYNQDLFQHIVSESQEVLDNPEASPEEHLAAQRVQAQAVTADYRVSRLQDITRYIDKEWYTTNDTPAEVNELLSDDNRRAQAALANIETLSSNYMSVLQEIAQDPEVAPYINLERFQTLVGELGQQPFTERHDELLSQLGAEMDTWESKPPGNPIAQRLAERGVPMALVDRYASAAERTIQWAVDSRAEIIAEFNHVKGKVQELANDTSLSSGLRAAYERQLEALDAGIAAVEAGQPIPEEVHNDLERVTQAMNSSTDLPLMSRLILETQQDMAEDASLEDLNSQLAQIVNSEEVQSLREQLLNNPDDVHLPAELKSALTQMLEDPDAFLSFASQLTDNQAKSVLFNMIQVLDSATQVPIMSNFDQIVATETINGQEQQYSAENLTKYLSLQFRLSNMPATLSQLEEHLNSGELEQFRTLLEDPDFMDTGNDDVDYIIHQAKVRLTEMSTPEGLARVLSNTEGMTPEQRVGQMLMLSNLEQIFSEVRNSSDLSPEDLGDHLMNTFPDMFTGAEVMAERRILSDVNALESVKQFDAASAQVSSLLTADTSSREALKVHLESRSANLDASIAASQSLGNYAAEDFGISEYTESISSIQDDLTALTRSTTPVGSAQLQSLMDRIDTQQARTTTLLSQLETYKQSEDYQNLPPLEQASFDSALAEVQNQPRILAGVRNDVEALRTSAVGLEEANTKLQEDIEALASTAETQAHQLLDRAAELRRSPNASQHEDEIRFLESQAAFLKDHIAAKYRSIQTSDRSNLVGNLAELSRLESVHNAQSALYANWETLNPAQKAERIAKFDEVLAAVDRLNQEAQDEEGDPDAAASPNDINAEIVRILSFDPDVRDEYRTSNARTNTTIRGLGQARHQEIRDEEGAEGTDEAETDGNESAGEDDSVNKSDDPAPENAPQEVPTDPNAPTEPNDDADPAAPETDPNPQTPDSNQDDGLDFLNSRERGGNSSDSSNTDSGNSSTEAAPVSPGQAPGVAPASSPAPNSNDWTAVLREGNGAMSRMDSDAQDRVQRQRQETRDRYEEAARQAYESAIESIEARSIYDGIVIASGHSFENYAAGLEVLANMDLMELFKDLDFMQDDNIIIADLGDSVARNLELDEPETEVQVEDNAEKELLEAKFQVIEEHTLALMAKMQDAASAMDAIENAHVDHMVSRSRDSLRHHTNRLAGIANRARAIIQEINQRIEAQTSQTAHSQQEHVAYFESLNQALSSMVNNIAAATEDFSEFSDNVTTLGLEAQLLQLEQTVTPTASFEAIEVSFGMPSSAPTSAPVSSGNTGSSSASSSGSTQTTRTQI